MVVDGDEEMRCRWRVRLSRPLPPPPCPPLAPIPTQTAPDQHTSTTLSASDQRRVQIFVPATAHVDIGQQSLQVMIQNGA